MSFSPGVSFPGVAGGVVLYRYFFVMKQVFNYSELHFSEVTSYKIHSSFLRLKSKDFFFQNVYLHPHVQTNPKNLRCLLQDMFQRLEQPLRWLWNLEVGIDCLGLPLFGKLFQKDCLYLKKLNTLSFWLLLLSCVFKESFLCSCPVDRKV